MVEDIRHRHHHMANVGVEPLVVLQVERRLNLDKYCFLSKYKGLFRIK